MDYRDKERKKIHKAELWFERDVFKNLLDERDEDVDLDKLVEDYKSKGANIMEEKKQGRKGKNVTNKTDKQSDDSDYNSDSSDDDDSESDYEVEKEIHVATNNVKKDGFEIVKKGKRRLNEEELALGTLMINSKKMKRDLVDGAWNRYAFNDEHLPDWFVQDEQKHMKKEAPVPKVGHVQIFSC